MEVRLVILTPDQRLRTIDFLLHLHDPVINDGKNIFTFLCIYIYTTGKTAECRENTNIVPEIKTGELQILPAFATNAYSRVKMATESIMLRTFYGSFFRVMAKRKTINVKAIFCFNV